MHVIVQINNISVTMDWAAHSSVNWGRPHSQRLRISIPSYLLPLTLLSHPEEKVAVAWERFVSLARERFNLVCNSACLCHGRNNLVCIVVCAVREIVDLLCSPVQLFKISHVSSKFVRETAELKDNVLLARAVCSRNKLLNIKRSVRNIFDVFVDSRCDVFLHHVNHRIHFNVEHLAVCFKFNLVMALHLCFIMHTIFFEQLDVLRTQVIFHCIRRRLEVQESAFCRFLHPAFIIAVAIEYDAAMVSECLLDESREVLVEVLASFKLVCKTAECICNNGVENRVRSGNRLS